MKTYLFVEVSYKNIPITEIEQSIHTTYQQKFEYHVSYFFFNNFQCFGCCMLAWLLYVFNRRLTRDFGPQVFSHESDPPRPIYGPFQILRKFAKLITGVNDTVGILLSVSLLSAINYRMCCWHRCLSLVPYFHWFHDNGNYFIGGNNNISNN